MALAKSASHDVIASEQQLADLIRQIQAADRVALDTEADSLHSYREKLCLLQISTPSAVILSNVEGSRGTASNVALPEKLCGWFSLAFARNDCPVGLRFHC